HLSIGKHSPGFMRVNTHPTSLAVKINLLLLPLSAPICYRTHVGLLRHGLRLCLVLHFHLE
ncbi:MAG: hypothetical protein LBO64_04925, partial [Desulfovibrio sp.]|nr:hypothetical protein [Desulfovibrio sp.]